MQSELTILGIRTIYEGLLRPDYIVKKTGRYCDAFVYYVSGETRYTFDTHSFTARSGDVIYLAKDSIYTMDVKEHGRFICIDLDFEPTSLSETCGEVRKSCIFHELSPGTENLFAKLLYAWNEKKPWHKSHCMSKIYEIYALCIASLTKKYSNSALRFAEISEYVSKNYSSSELSVSQIAEAAGITEVQLRRIFKSEVNTSPAKYINFLRLEKAKALLSGTNMTISEIAAASGISDTYYFSRLFKKELGITPTKFRSTNS